MIDFIKWLLFLFFSLTLVISLVISKSSISSTSNSSSQACAACKYQRRRCTPECLLAPYFPADQTKMFLNAHRLFGVANMSRIIKDMKKEERDDAMQSIKFESSMWERFPSKGCCAVMAQLMSDTKAYEASLSYVRSLIEMARQEKYRPDQTRASTSTVAAYDQYQYNELETDVKPWTRHRQRVYDTIPDVVVDDTKERRGVIQGKNKQRFEPELKPPLCTQQQEHDIEAQYDAISEEALVEDDDIDIDDDDDDDTDETKEAYNVETKDSTSNGSNLEEGAAENAEKCFYMVHSH